MGGSVADAGSEKAKKKTKEKNTPKNHFSFI